MLCLQHASADFSQLTAPEFLSAPVKEGMLLPLSAALLIVVVAIALIYATRRRDRAVVEAFVPGGITAEAVARATMPHSDLRGVSIGDDHVVLHDSPQAGIQLTLTEYQIPMHVVKTFTDDFGRTLVQLSNAYELLASNAVVFSRFRFQLIHPEDAVIRATDVLQVVGRGGKPLMHLLKDITHFLGAWGLRFQGPAASLAMHDACLSVPQNTFFTTEVAKFNDVIGCTLVYSISDRDFTVAFCLKKVDQATQFVAIKSLGDDLHLCYYNMTAVVTNDASTALDAGLSTMARKRVGVHDRRLTTDAVLTGALAQSPTQITVEVVRGQARVVVKKRYRHQMFAFKMPAMMEATHELATDLVEPPRVAWRSTSGRPALYTFPMCDLR
jgi:hypothetical protein